MSVYARKLGISYRTAHRWFKAGKVPGYQADTGTIIVTDPIVEAISKNLPQRVALYTRVSAAGNKDNLEGPAKRLADYCAVKGYQVASVVKEIGSGVNDTRPKLLKLLTDPTIAIFGLRSRDRLDCGGTQGSPDPFWVQLHPAIAGSNCWQCKVVKSK